MENKEFIFIAGLNRSGTSLLHEIIRQHREISGFHGTGALEDEGQYLQSVFEPGIAFGGPGQFAFDDDCYMDEFHPLATPENAQVIFDQWGEYWDLSRKVLIEKSPTNILRTRFLQQLYPKSKFIILLRHPLVVALATKKWAKEISVSVLIEHSIVAYETVLRDMTFLKSVYILTYEQFVRDPQEMIDKIFSFIGLETIKVKRKVHADINGQYFKFWDQERQKTIYREFFSTERKFEERSNRLGYSIRDYEMIIPVTWLGAHRKSDMGDDVLVPRRG